MGANGLSSADGNPALRAPTYRLVTGHVTCGDAEAGGWVSGVGQYILLYDDCDLSFRDFKHLDTPWTVVMQQGSLPR